MSSLHTQYQAAAELGCDTSSTQAWIDCLREQDPWVLLNATNPLECNVSVMYNSYALMFFNVLSWWCTFKIKLPLSPFFPRLTPSVFISQ